MNRWVFFFMQNSIFATVMTETKRYFLELAYKGTNYHGWQIQLNAKSVQEELEKYLSLLLQEKTSVMGSGRTDTGVHASQQFAHFDLQGKALPHDFLKKLNAMLPKDIAIYAIREVKANAHARFHAQWRRYEYKISLRKNPFEQETAWIYFKELDVSKMNDAAALLLEHTDFQCFSKVRTDVTSFNCKIKAAYWEQNGEELFFHITANRFLRGMVRAIVGTLVNIGNGNISIDDFQEILNSKSRANAKSSAPPQGLFLSEVYYPEELFI